MTAEYVALAGDRAFAGAARTRAGEELNLVDRERFELCWIVDFPFSEWSEEEKRRIVAEAESAGASVSLVARRHDVNANQLFTWRRRLRRQESGAGLAAFIPAVIEADASVAAGGSAARPSEADAGIGEPSAGRPAGLIEIILAGGRRVIVDSAVSAAALGRVVGVLERPAVGPSHGDGR